MLVGGGELHDEWSSLVGVAQPLGRYIQRFTGISQAMVDAAPAPEDVLPQLAHAAAQPRARRPQRALRRARAAAGVRARRARVAGPAGDLHGAARAPVPAAAAPPRARDARRRARGSRSTRSTARCRTRARARGSSARCSAACARTRRRSATRSRCSARARSARARRRSRSARAASARTSPRSRTSRASTSSATPTAARSTSASRSTCARARASHFTTGAAWTAEAEHVDHQVTESELGALLLEDRLIKALKPPGNIRGKREPDGYVYIRCRLDIPFPILEVAREPAAGPRGLRRPGARPRRRGRAGRAAQLALRPAPLRPRSCPRREHPSAYGQMGRCLSPCLHDLDPNLYRERLDAALRLFVGRNGGEALLARVDEQIAEASAAAALRARRLAAAPARAARGPARPPRPRAARDPHRRPARARPAPGGSGALRRDLDRRRPGRRLGRGRRLAARAALAARVRHAPAPGKLGGWLPADAVAEARLVGAWIAANQPPRDSELTGRAPASRRTRRSSRRLAQRRAPSRRQLGLRDEPAGAAVLEVRRVVARRRARRSARRRGRPRRAGAG